MTSIFPKTLKEFKPLLILEDTFTHHERKMARHLFGIIAFVALAFCAALYFSPSGGLESFVDHAFQIRGLFVLSFASYLLLAMLEAYYYSWYQRMQEKSPVSFEVASLLFAATESDITYSFLSEIYGWAVLDRLGINEEEIIIFLGKRKNPLQHDQCPFLKEGAVLPKDLSEYALALRTEDKEFADFLFSYGVTDKELKGAAAWVQNNAIDEVSDERWWARERLGRIPGLAKNWAYGQTFLLDSYAEDLTEKAFSHHDKGRTLLMKGELQAVEAVLSRNREANVLVVGDDEGEKMALIDALAKEIERGSISPELEHKRIFSLKGSLLIERNPNKAAFESELNKLMLQAVQSGNSILVITDFSRFLASAHTIGSDIGTLMATYVNSPNLQIVGLCDPKSFHQDIETKTELMQYFEVVQVKTKDTGYLIELLQTEAQTIEARTGLLFTYQSLECMAESAFRYFSSAPSADKVIDLLAELIPRMIHKKKRLVEKTDVLEMIEQKTGIPMGEVKEAEKEKLVNLEKILHQHIVGQEQAITAISQALRRSRSGLRNPDKPIGSFLFLGPTGVGKTETTKALAEVFFGAEAPIIRVDMSEYTGSDALAKLIGSYEVGKAGILANEIREHPYGVLLLDEFEKAHSDVHNLFLQVLDEGFFSDMEGVKVNARNLIIIATSNAGSDIIFQLVGEGADIVAKREEIIAELIREKIFRPELLNRFDGLVVFHPLLSTHIDQVARLMLEKVQARIRERGVNLIVNEDLIHFLVGHGSDTKFGARPMNRAIDEFVEEPIAQKLITGEIKGGSKVEFVKDGSFQDGKLMLKVR